LPASSEIKFEVEIDASGVPRNAYSTLSVLAAFAPHTHVKATAIEMIALNTARHKL
jgi:hypothetical protein